MHNDGRGGGGDVQFSQTQYLVPKWAGVAISMTIDEPYGTFGGVFSKLELE